MALNTTPRRRVPWSPGERGAWLLIACCAGLAAWNPPWPGRVAPIDLVVAVDRSASVGDAGRAARDALVLDALPAGSRVQAFAFADRPGSDGRAPAPGATDLGAALDAALQRLDPGRAGRILLLSDGLATRPGGEAALRSALAAGVPVLLHAVMPERSAPAARLLPPPDAAPRTIGDDAMLRVRVAAREAGAYRVTLRSGSREVAARWLEADADRVLETHLALPTPAAATAGAIAYELRLADANGRPLDRLAGRLRFASPAGLLYVSESPGRPLAQALVAGGWVADSTVPARLRADPVWLAGYGLVILDDIAAERLDAGQQAALATAVSELGSGLLVLGGPRSFAGGGYRHSVLETLLPLLSEPAAPAPGSALLFVVDTSGSMVGGRAGEARLALARQAVVATASGLGPEDRVGLITFAAETQERLPLARHAAPGAALDAAWRSDAAGGTRPTAALTLALGRLAEAPERQRLLVLVSDGNLGTDDLAPLAEVAAANGVRVLAVAVGARADTARLATLAAPGDLFRVAASAELPRLLRRAVDGARLPPVAGPVTPQPVAALPWVSPDRWPPLTAYQVTRLRDGATRHLAAPGGDPLLASWQAGAGRVVALSGGLAEWAPAWPAWPGWPELAGGLAAWTARLPADGLVAAHDDGMTLHVDVATRDGTWSTAEALPLALVDADGRTHSVRARSTAPGRYAAALPALPPGPLTVATAAGTLELQHGDDAERIPDRAAIVARDAWLEEGLLRPWPRRDTLPEGLLPPAPGGTRALLATLALALLLVLLYVRARPATERTDTLPRARASTLKEDRHGIRAAA